MTVKSIENDRPLGQYTSNPFTTETRLYEKQHQPSDIPATVVVPDFYHVALPNLGHQMVEHQLNQIPGFFADRSYLSQDFRLLKENPEVKPELIFVSMSYEGSCLRSLRALDLMGIPLRKQDRKEGDPLVVFGGWSVSRNPLPLFEVADVIGVGDSEHLITNIAKAYKENRDSKQGMFDSLAEKRGIIIPSRYKVETDNGRLTTWEPEEGVPSEIYPSESTVFPHSWYLSPETDYNDIGYYDGKTFFSMEIVDACASKCAFCASGYKNKVRDIQDPSTVASLAEWGTKYGGDLVKLFFPANSSLISTKAIMKELMAQGLSPRVGSAKAERIDKEYIGLVGRSGQEKIAFAPETGDYELRKRIGKPGMTDRVLQEVVAASIDAGIPNLDFYLIMNLPGETPDSFKKTVDLIGELHNVARSKGLKGRVRISAPNFFPKAGTPFQYAPSGGLETYSEKVDALEKDLGGIVAVSSMKANVDLLSQNIMSRGGPEAGIAMIEVYNKLKQRELATGQYIPDTFADWREALSAVGIDERVYFDERSTDNPLPWHHIHMSDIRLDSLKKVWDVFKVKRALFVLY